MSQQMFATSPSFTQPQLRKEKAPDFVHKSPAMSHLISYAEAVARYDTTVLITGESGTGKEVISSFIHQRGGRASQPLVTVNCGALPENLFESEFFGHERGAFTGAATAKVGLVEAADKATLFLDEIGEMPLMIQVKLLRFLEQRQYRRVGSTQDRTADVRIIAATNRHLAGEVAAGRFRSDLYYRLNVVSLKILPLRERREDIPELITFYLILYRQRFNRPHLRLSREAKLLLESHYWPGNVRELRNCLEQAVALSPTDEISASLIHLEKTEDVKPPADLLRREGMSFQSCDLEEVEKQHISHALRLSRGNRERAAAMLGISVRTLYRRLRSYEFPQLMAGQQQVAME